MKNSAAEKFINLILVPDCKITRQVGVNISPSENLITEIMYQCYNVKILYILL
jgi:hypothetical protein